MGKGLIIKVWIAFILVILGGFFAKTTLFSFRNIEIKKNATISSTTNNVDGSTVLSGLTTSNYIGMSASPVFLDVLRSFSRQASFHIINGSTNSYSSVEQKGVSSEEHQPQQGFFSIVGSLVNFSGGQIDTSGDVLLTVYSGSRVVEVMTTPLLPDHTFRFYLVPFHPDWTYEAAFTHKNILFKSKMINGIDYASADTVSVTIMIFDSSSDVQLLRGERMLVVLGFEHEGYVHVIESMLIFNPSSFVVIPENDQTPLIMFPLDSRISSLKFADTIDTAYYKVIDSGFGDWQPVFPGAVHHVMFEYDLPFDGNDAIGLSIPIPIDSILVVVDDKDSEVSCSGSQLVNQKPSPASEVEIFHGMLKRGDTQLAINCLHKNQLVPLIIGMAALVFAAIISVFVFRESRKRQKDKDQADPMDIDQTILLDAVIALDDRFAAGEISRASYNAKRKELVKKIKG